MVQSLLNPDTSNISLTSTEETFENLSIVYETKTNGSCKYLRCNKGSSISVLFSKTVGHNEETGVRRRGQSQCCVVGPTTGSKGLRV